jgi:hypothetical protein
MDALSRAPILFLDRQLPSVSFPEEELMTVNEYLEKVPDDQASFFAKLRQSIKKGLPKGFEEAMNYGMIGYVVPHSLYASGYHCNPKDPLPFMNIAAKKNNITLYHMGIYGDEELKEWFFDEYARHSKHKIDTGKGCIRFKYYDEIPYGLITELVSRISVNEWIGYYEKEIKPPKPIGMGGLKK